MLTGSTGLVNGGYIRKNKRLMDDMELPEQVKAAKPYHHGNLAPALVAATVELIGEHGIEKLSLREVAKRVGVSSGAPFRHFSTKCALLTAVAEEAAMLLRKCYEDEIEALQSDDPLEQYMAIGDAYLRWAMEYPTHFSVRYAINLIDVKGSELLQKESRALREKMLSLLTRANSQGLLSKGLDIEDLILGGRALTYGLARMAVDGHIAHVLPAQDRAHAISGALHAYIGQIRARPAA